jgi:hypothetical protein
MPKQYEEIRDSYVRKGVNYDRAQAIAAATYRKITGKNVQDAARHEKKGKRGGRR